MAPAIFDSRFKFKAHIAEIVLIIAAIVLSVARLFMNVPTSRANMMAIGMGAKSLLFLLYQMLSEHVERFKKWKSLKAYTILNALEIVFWAAVLFMTIQANTVFCVGPSCAMSWVLAVIAGILSILAAYTAVICYLDFRYFRTYGVSRGSAGTNNFRGYDGGESNVSVAMDQTRK